MHRPRDKIHFTVEERILIHLYDFKKFDSQIQVPLNITQQGIGLGVCINTKHVPRSIKRLIDDGLIVERTAHVVRKKQRMKTYHLTNKGCDHARQLIDFVSGLRIKIKTSTNEFEELIISEIKEKLHVQYSIAQILAYLTKTGILDVTKIVETTETNEKKRIADPIQVYARALAQAWADGKMTRDEKDLLQNLRESLNISDADHVALEEDILENVEKNANKQVLAVYNVALDQALADDKISDDERAILEKIKKRFRLKGV